MIEKVHLYDSEIVEIEGEFKEVKKNEEVLPCMLTNHSLYVGKRDGLLETSLVDELYNVISVFQDSEVDPMNINEEDLADYGAEMFKRMAQVVDEDKMMKIIYLGLIGANPKLEMSYEEFTIKYHGDMEEKMSLYVNLVSNLASRENKFKKEFEKNTSRKRAKGEKKQ